MLGVYGLLLVVLDKQHLIATACAQVGTVTQMVVMPPSALFFLHTQQKVTTVYSQVVETLLRKLSFVC